MEVDEVAILVISDPVASLIEPRTLLENMSRLVVNKMLSIYDFHLVSICVVLVVHPIFRYLHSVAMLVESYWFVINLSQKIPISIILFLLPLFACINFQSVFFN